MSGRYIARKALGALVTIIAIVLLNFVLFRMMPGSPERAVKNPNLTPEFIAELRARYGLDKPILPDQLVSYIESTAQGDLGYSIKYRGAPVTDVLFDAVGPTVLLIGLGEAVAIVIGLWIGARSGWKRGGGIDRVGNGISLVLYSMPYFVIGMPLIIVFASGLGWFPTSGMTTPGGDKTPIEAALDLLHHLVLPLTAVALGLIGAYSILMRSAIIETRAEDYITTARAKGLSDGRILNKHAFPNALLPMVTLIAINLGYVVAGAITAEVVFSWPGLGTLTVQALDSRDYPLLQGDLPADRRVGRAGQLRRGHRLRVPRPEGAGMSVTGIAGPELRSRRFVQDGPPRRRLHGPPPRPDGRPGRDRDPVRVHAARAVSEPVRGAAGDADVGDRPAAAAARAPSTGSAPTSSAGTSSTSRSTARGSR